MLNTLPREKKKRDSAMSGKINTVGLIRTNTDTRDHQYLERTKGTKEISLYVVIVLK